MSDRQCGLPLRKLLSAAVGALLIGIASDAGAQTTQRASHKELLAQASELPIMQPRYTTPEGRPLSDEQKAALERSAQFMEIAEQQRGKGDYQAAARACTDALELRRKILGVPHYLTISATVEAGTLSQIAAALPEVRKRFAEADQQLAAAEEAHDKGDYVKAFEAASRAVGLYERMLGAEHAEVALALRVLGREQTELQRSGDADKSLTRSLRICESTFGKNHPETALTLDRVAWLLFNRKKYEKAEETERRAVRIFRTSVGENADTAEALDNLGSALVYARDPKGALAVKLRALVIREAVLGPEASDTGVSLSNLAWLYARTGRKEEAVSLRTRAIEIFRKALGPDHPWVSLEQANLAEFYRSAGRLEEAVEIQRQLVARDERRADPADTGAIGHLTGLGAVYFDLQHPDDAMRTLKKAVERAKACYAAGRIEATTSALSRLFRLFQGRRMLEDAVAVLELIRDRNRSSLGNQADAAMIERGTQLGRMYVSLGRLKDGKRVLKETIERATKLYGNGALEAARPLLNLVQALEKLGELDEAERVCEQLLKISEAKLAPRSRGNAYALTALGRIQTRQNRLVLAQFSLEEAKAMFDELEGRNADPVGRIAAMQALAACHLAAGAKDEATTLLHESLTLARQVGEKARGANVDALVAQAIWRIMDAIDTTTEAGRKEHAALKAELIKLLHGLREARALDAENRQWLKEVEGAGG